MLASFFKDGAVYGLIKVVTSSSALLLLPLYTRTLTLEEYGTLDFLTISANLLYIIISLEIAQGFARCFCDSASSAEDKIRYASTTLWFTLTVYSLFLVIAFFFSAELSDYVFDSSKHEDVIQVAALAIWGQGIFSLVQNQLRYELRPKHYAIASLGFTLMLVAMVLVLLLVFHLGVAGVFLAQLSGSLTGLALGVYFARKSYQYVFDWEKCKEMLRFSLPLVFSSVGVFFALYLDRIAIKSLMSMESLGVYAVGYRVATVVSLALVGFQMALTPLIYKNYQNESAPKDIEQIFRCFLALICPLILIATLFADDILALVATPVYADAYQVIFPLAMAFLLSNVYLFAPGVWIAKKTGWISGINVVVAGVNIALNFTLIPLLGIVGAAIATCLSALVGLFCYVLLGQSLYKIPYRWTPIVLSFTILLLIGAPTMVVTEFWTLQPSLWAFVVKLFVLIVTSGGIAMLLLGQERRNIGVKIADFLSQKFRN